MRMTRWTRWCAAALCACATSVAAAQEEDFQLDLDEEPSGPYLSLIGFWVMQQDADADASIPGLGGLDGEIEFDEGFGGAFALGHRYPDVPLSVEFEYSFRTAEGDTPGIDADLDTHAF